MKNNYFFYFILFVFLSGDECLQSWSESNSTITSDKNFHINANINRIELSYDTQPLEDIYIVTYHRAIYKDQKSKVYEYISKNYPD